MCACVRVCVYVCVCVCVLRVLWAKRADTVEARQMNHVLVFVCTLI